MAKEAAPTEEARPNDKVAEVAMSDDADEAKPSDTVGEEAVPEDLRLRWWWCEYQPAPVDSGGGHGLFVTGIWTSAAAFLSFAKTQITIRIQCLSYDIFRY